MIRNRGLFSLVAGGIWAARGRASLHALSLGLLSLGLLSMGLGLSCPSQSQAAVVLFDGFGDGDLNNNGIAFEPIDTDVSLSGAADSYNALGNGGTPLVFPMDTAVTESTVADNPNDKGIRWLNIGGFTTPNSTTGESDGTASIRIIDDSTGHLPETNAAIGFFNAISNTTQVSAAINDGLALGVETKGRGRGFAGFFETDLDYANGKQGTIQLGPKVDDEVRVSFDFRVWMSASNFNSNATNHIPQFGQLRFGLFQDTDNQLGETNNFAGQPNATSGIPGPSIWGVEGGLFRGDALLDGPDATGDHGWHVRLPLKDPSSGAGIPAFGGLDARIVEETNDRVYGASERLLDGNDNDTVASPDAPTFINLELTKVYNVELSLKRFDETNGGATGQPGDNIMATVTVKDRATPEQTFTFSGFDALGVAGTNDDDGGFESDSWDYFAMVVAGASSSDDFDFLIDNFMLEVLGSNAPQVGADRDNDGDVDGADFLAIQRTDPSLIPLWESEFGGQSSGAMAVPEPSGLLLTLWAACGLLRRPGAMRFRR